MKTAHRLIAAFLILDLALILLLSLIFYNKTPATGEALSNIQFSKLDENEDDEFPHTQELHYTHSNLTYSFKDEKSCGKVQAFRLRWGFEEIQKQISLTFTETDGETDIEIYCYREVPSPMTGYVTAGEANYEHIENKIIKGIIIFYNSGVSGTYGGGCTKYPDTEIHEILHTFGFEHSENPRSIMFPYGDICRHKIDEETINKLKEIYGLSPNLPLN